MADLLLFGRLPDARRAGQRRFRCFNAHLMHTVILGLQGKLVEITSLSLRIISLRSVAQLLKLSTICKSPLHGPRNYDDHTWKRSANYSARTDHGLKQFFFGFSQQYYASPKKKKPIQSATIDLTLHCLRYGFPSPRLHRYRKISS